MNPTDWNEIKQIFAAAFEMPPGERAEFLNKYPEDLRLEAEKLFRAHDAAADFIAEPAAVALGLSDESTVDPFIGKQIDAYQIIREIGRGGMGTVYLANRADGSFDKPVALKLIKRGMDTTAVLKRFVMERQILAQLQHPNIAALLDGGTTADGLPYFVMEYVEGEPVTKFCDKHSFSVKERLDLFRDVCSAVSHAHQNLVVHRDIKPSNILVTKNGTPKLLDFGIAKLLNPEWSLDTDEATATMFRLMTPEYASPEQIRGLPITTASDVYSLGVVLYELLCGRRPYKIENRLPGEIANIVLTEEPIRPSMIVENVTHQNDPAATGSVIERPHFTGRQELKGDLDNIILKALRKERDRRYASVEEFSEDIRRSLSGLPVNATADTSIYRLNKFVQRHRTGVFAAGLVMLTLLAATGITTWQAVVANRERAKAEQRFAEVREMANKLLFEYNDKIKQLPGTVELRQNLVTDALRYLDNLAQDGQNDITLERELIVAYEKVGEVQFGLSNGNIGDSSGSLQSYRKAVAIAEKVVSEKEATREDRIKLVDVYSGLAGGLGQTGDIHADIEVKQKAISLLKQIIAEQPQDATQQNRLANNYLFLATPLAITGDDAGAKENLNAAIEIYRTLQNADPQNDKYRRNLAIAYKYLNTLLNRTGEAAQGLEYANAAYEIDKIRFAAAPNDPRIQFDLSATYTAIGDSQLALDKPKDAEKAFLEALAIRELLSRNDPKNVYFQDMLAGTQHRLAKVNLKLGDLAQAVEFASKAIAQIEISISKDVADVYNQIYLAQYKLTLGLVHLAMTEKSGGSSKQACGDLNDSVAIWKTLDEKKAVPKYNEAEMKLAREKLAACANN